DVIGVDHHYRAQGAAVQAAGLVGAYLAGAGQTQFLDALLGVFVHLAGAQVVAAAFAIGALVGAEEDVVLEITHFNASWRRPAIRSAAGNRVGCPAARAARWAARARRRGGTRA